MPHLSHDLDDEKPVCICIEGNALTVTPKDVQISVDKKERVHWFLRDRGTIDSITFGTPSGPFQGPHLVHRLHMHSLSQTVVNKDHIGKNFKYTVVVTTSNGKPLSLDPGVDVMP